MTSTITARRLLRGNEIVEYLGSRQRIVYAANDKLGIEPEAAPS
jgi:hypothetical protein